MSNHPEVAVPPPGLEVDLSASSTALHYSPHHAEQHQQQVPLKSEYDGQAARVAPASTSLICGVRRSTFWLAVILAIVVIGAAVGGGVGGSIAVSNARSKAKDSTAQGSPTPSPVTVTIAGTSSPAASPTASASDASAYTPKPANEVLKIDNSCPSDVVESYTKADGAKDSYNCREKNDFGSNDIVWFTAYTLQACVDACTSYNEGNKSDVECKGVALAENLSVQSETNHGANCWLKMAMDEAQFGNVSTMTLAWLEDA